MAETITNPAFRMGHTTEGMVIIGVETPDGPKPFIQMTPAEAVEWADELMRQADNAVHASRAARRG